MSINIKYKPNAFEEKQIEYSVEKPDFLIPVLKEMKELYIKEYHELFTEKVCILINGEKWNVDEWNYCMLEDEDEVDIIPEVLGGKGAGVLMLAIGVVLIATGYGAPAGVGAVGFAKAGIYGTMMLMGASMVLSGMIAMMYKAPSVVGYGGDTTSDSPTYSWDGLSMTQLSNIPIPVVYGEHDVAGNLISFYTTNDGVDTFLHMLIALSEGEIDGIMKEDNSAVCTSTDHIPNIKINNQNYSIYNRGESYIEWDYRTGTNTQTVISGFSNIHTYYSDGREITNNWIQYETTSDLVNQVDVFINAPALFKMNTKTGELETTNVDFEIQTSTDSVTWNTPHPRNSVASASNLVSTSDTSLEWTTLWDAGTHNISSTNTIIALDLYPYFSNIDIHTLPPSTGLRILGGPDGTQLKYEGPPPRTPQNFRFEYITSYSTEHIIIQGKTGVTSKWIKDGDYWVNVYHTLNITNRTVTIGGTRISGKTKSAVNKTVNIRNLESGTYYIRVRRDNPASTDINITDNIYLTGIDEITYNNLTYPNTALLFLKIKASSVISGGVPNVVTRIRGIKVSVPKLTISGDTQTYNNCYWDGSVYKRISDDTECVDSGLTVTQWTQNPVYCTKDIKINNRYGLGYYVTDNDIDNTYLNIAAKYAWELVSENLTTSEHKFHLDINIDNEQEAWQVIAMLAKTFRGWVVWSEGKIKFLCDKEDIPVQLFTMGNVIKDSVTEQFSSISQIPNIIECQFANSQRDYTVDVREVIYEPDWTSGKPKRVHKEDFRGITRESQLVREGIFFLNCARYRTKMLSFSSGLDSIHCVAGDLIYFQHEMPEYGYGGRIKEVISASAIITDLDFTATTNGILMCRLSNGDIEEYTAQASPLINRITTATVFSVTPRKEDLWAYGKRNTDVKTYRILSVDRSNNDEVSITSLEYNASVYNDSHVLIASPLYNKEVIDEAALAPPVQDLILSELTSGSGIYVSFTPPTTSFVGSIPTPNTTYSHAEVWVSTDGGGQYYFVNNDYGMGDTKINTVPGVTCTVKVYSVNKLNIRNDASPVISNITPAHFTPLTPTGLRLDQSDIFTGEWEGKDPKFTWRKPSAVSGIGAYGAGWEPGGLGQWQAADYDSLYRVEVWKDSTQKRSEIVKDNRYIYSYEKNLYDFVTPASSFNLRVYGWNDRANLKSNDYAEIFVKNKLPNTVSSLTSVSVEDGVQFKWGSGEEDIDYYLYRYAAATSVGIYGASSDWAIVKGNKTDVYESVSDMKNRGRGRSEFRFEVKAVDLYGDKSISSSTTTASTINLKSELIVAKNGGLGIFTSVASAIDAVPSGGCQIKIYEGTYDINATIVLPAKDIDIIGVSRNSVILQNNEASYSNALFYDPGNNNNYSFKNLTLKSRSKDVSSSILTSLGLLHFDGIGNGRQITVENNRFILKNDYTSSKYMPGDNGVLVTPGTFICKSCIDINGCEASGGFAPFNIWSCDKLRVNKNTIASSSYGIYIGKVNDIKVNDNTIKNCFGIGIFEWKYNYNLLSIGVYSGNTYSITDGKELMGGRGDSWNVNPGGIVLVNDNRISENNIINISGDFRKLAAESIFYLWGIVYYGSYGTISNNVIYMDTTASFHIHPHGIGLMRVYDGFPSPAAPGINTSVSNNSITVIGSDHYGYGIRAYCKNSNINNNQIFVGDNSTGIANTLFGIYLSVGGANYNNISNNIITCSSDTVLSTYGIALTNDVDYNYGTGNFIKDFDFSVSDSGLENVFLATHNNFL